MGFDFLKELASVARPRRGVIAFREAQWDAPPNSPMGEWVARVKKEIRVEEVRRAGGMARVTCRSGAFEPLPRGAEPPQYLPSVSVDIGPDGSRDEVSFRRLG
jgi:hypothetical protein